ncbi:MAG: hypothetical protein GX290_00080, partial [Treponema sp.]|nr:hypothetical protein [Treponema sp.]
IVRGTTARRLIQILRKAGAKEVHFRISSPPVKYPCYFGIDTPVRADLISATHDTAEICKAVGADSLAFISMDGMVEALETCVPERAVDTTEQNESRKSEANDCCFCQGCFLGEYPMSMIGEIGKR